MLLFNIKIRGDYHFSHCTETITVCNMIISIHNDGNDDVDYDDDVDNDDGDDDADDAVKGTPHVKKMFSFRHCPN